jgi:hypothetical protein
VLAASHTSPFMDLQLTNELIRMGSYIAYTIWAILSIVLLTSLFKRNWQLTKRTSKYLLNSVVFIIAFMFIVELSLFVRPPIYETKKASAMALKSWVENYQVKDIYIALATTSILFGVNLFFYFKIEKKRHRKDLFLLTIFDAFILSAGIWLTGQDAYWGLMQEINRHFV